MSVSSEMSADVSASSSGSQLTFETLCSHIGHTKFDSERAYDAVSPPLIMTTTFLRADDGSYPHGYCYGRIDNPNRKELEECLALLEHGKTALAFPSGLAAISCLFQSLKPGDHIIMPSDLYMGTRAQLVQIFSTWNLLFDFVDTTDLEAIKAAIKPDTKLLYLETPSNPRLFVTDITACAAIAQEHGFMCAVDNTWNSPYLQRPLELGADIVIHSTTKYLSGHSDVTGGALVLSEKTVQRQDGAYFKRLSTIQHTCGAVPSPFDCWLTLRGIRTLHVRMMAHCNNAMRVAEFLSKHPLIHTVHYPGLESHAGHLIAKKNNRVAAFGGMLSFQIVGGAKAAFSMISHLNIFKHATSLGGVESLIEQRASIEGPSSPTPPDLVRVSVGIEHVEDLIADLKQALDKTTSE